ncbi:MAG: glutamate mutase L [Prevotella sp.]|jgi:hypothetical protein|nr:glutamate mutase L [Prevotella sp.]
MSKVFRLYNIQGNNNIVDWDNSNVYGTTAISQIADPDGADAKKEITSIPSPFARIDLIKTAFKEVVDIVRKAPNLDRLTRTQLEPLVNGKTIYHRMVSDALDVAEIFFNFDRFKNYFEIIVWDREKDLDKNNVFGKTLKRYLESDATGDDPYNFGKLNRIYMLNYVGPDRPSSMNIVGATSPATLFFSSANDLSYVSKNVAIGLDRPFDDEFQPLFKRDFEFQKYLFAFRKAYDGFSHDFPELHNYLDISYKCLSDEQKREIDALTAGSISGYEPIAVGEKGENTFEILGKPFHKKPNVTNWKSDFEIKSDLYAESKKPLVLPVEKGNTYANLRFTTDNWGKENRAPYEDRTAWPNRRLPIVNDEYPYLTISDFLADTIVRMPYEINKSSFFDGNLPQQAASYKDEDGNIRKCSFLLPLTETFFKFFSADDLQGTIEGKKMFEFVELQYGIKVILRIPIQKGFVEYIRAYFDDGKLPQIKNNDGALITKVFGLGIMPFVKFPANVKKHYRIALFDCGEYDTRLSFCSSKNDVAGKRVERNKKNIAQNLSSSEAYAVSDNFDRIEVHVGTKTTGIIIPKYVSAKGKGDFTFAIDFGTTNSHIEYDVDNAKNPKPFDMPLSEKQLHRLHIEYDDRRDIELGIAQDFIPDKIEENTDYSFPMRTVFSERLGLDYTQNPTALADGNIPFSYEKEEIPDYNLTQTELKWGGIPDKLIKLYLENLFLLLRNKVLWNNGNLEATKIVWFYPASMTEGRCNEFKRIWKGLYKEYFGEDDQNVICMSESIAPYHYFVNTKGRKSDVVTIDIGGGTTDVYAIENYEEKMLLSFRFASNTVFGDAYGHKSDTNGFVNLYNDTFVEILNRLKLSGLVSVLSKIKNKKISSDIIAFYFSLYYNSKVNKNDSLNFLLELSKNQKLKYVFILFYGAIFYFIAKTMKAKGLKKTLVLGFSGNGSKTLSVLSDDNEMIGKFAKLIFDGVYDGTYSGNGLEIRFEGDKEPKTATCKGGIHNCENQDFDSIDNIKNTVIGNALDTISDKKYKYSNITDSVINDVVSSVAEFIDFLFRISEENNNFIVNKLSADKTILQTVKEFCLNREELRQSLIAGLQEKYQELNNGNKINDPKVLQKIKEANEVEDTLFFYPLIGVLHDLALKISKM